MLCTSPRPNGRDTGGVRRRSEAGGFDEVFSLAVDSKVLPMIGVE
jgi:hypothetical protein